MKTFFFFLRGGVRSGGGVGLGGQGGCARRIEVFVKIQKNLIFFGGVGAGGGGSGGQWEGSGGGGGVRVDVNEIEVFVKIQKKIFFFFGGGGRGVSGRVGLGGSGWM